MDKTMLRQLLENLPAGLQHVRFEGSNGSHELHFVIGPATEKELPVHLSIKQNSKEIKNLFERCKKPHWKLTCSTVNNYGVAVLEDL